MALTPVEILITIAVMSAGTMITRFLPLLCFPESKQTPKLVLYFGRVLPYAAMGLLIIYCLKDVSITAPPFALPELISILCIAALHLWKKNAPLSIGAGTVIYILLTTYL